MKTVKYLFVLAGLLSISNALASEPGKKLGDGNDGNRSGPVHIINLKDENGLTIDPQDELPKPISMKNTCGECHNYDKIASGWHFQSGHVKPKDDSNLIYLDQEVPGGFKEIDSGRNGQPWVLIDPATRSQIPVSNRGWKGAYSPHDVKLRPWDMVKLTASHSPGGNYGEMKPSDDVLDLLDEKEIPYGMAEPVKWMNSGKLEVNCLACHSADPKQDMGGDKGSAMQIARENFRWAATAGSGIGSVSGAVLGVDFFDIETDDTVKTVYDKSRFDDDKKVFIDIVKSPPAARCYFCHSNQDIVKKTEEVEVTEFVKVQEDQADAGTPEAGAEITVAETEDKKAPEPVTRIDTVEVDMTQELGWVHDEDIHLKSGMTCSDCHRNGVDHMISRGDKEFSNGGMGEVSTLSCRGCHLGDQTADSKAAQKGGRMSAPKPEHAGIPTIHFKELACTACHSGPYPAQEAGLVRTSRIHKIGLHGPHNPNWKNPHISSPVFIRSEDTNRIAPHKMFWPAFWATMVDVKNEDGTTEQSVMPFKPSLVAELAGDVLDADRIPAADMMLGDWRPLSESQILETLQIIAGEIEEPGEGAPVPQAVYIAGGRLYKVVETKSATDDADAEYGLVTEDSKVAEPYAWPIAHDVRPASQSLGTEGHCDDCHGFRNDSAFFYGKVAVDSPVVADAVMEKEPAELKKALKDLAANAPVRKMVSFQEISPMYIWAFNTSFVFRPIMKITVLLCCGLIGAVLAMYGLKAVCCIARAVSQDDK